MWQRLGIFLYVFLLSFQSVIGQVNSNSSTGNDLSQQQSSLIEQMVEQNLADSDAILGSSFGQLMNGSTGTAEGNETYQGIKQFWNNDLLGNFGAAISQAISNAFNQLFNTYLPSIVSSLSGVIKSFFLNANLAQITTNNTNNANDLSSLLNQLASTIYGIAFDLLFALFVLAIWQYWTKASWQGSVSPMSAVGRLIFTMAIVLAWPTIYGFEIELSNEMISAIFAGGANQLNLFDMAMANMFNIGMYSGLLGTLMINPSIAAGVTSLSFVLSALAPLALCILAIILIYELVYLIVLKAMQMALLIAQYVFAPIFLIFFATPSTERIATGYIRTFAETSVWSFVWIGLLKILLVLLYASFNPFGKIITAIGILQLMMRVPQFLAHARISVASDFVNPAIFTRPLQTMEHAKQTFAQSGAVVSEMKRAFKDTFTHSSSNSRVASEAKFGFESAGENTVRFPGSKVGKSSHASANVDLPNSDNGRVIIPPVRRSESNRQKNIDKPIILPVNKVALDIKEQSINSAAEVISGDDYSDRPSIPRGTTSASRRKPPLQLPLGQRRTEQTVAAAFLDPSVLPRYKESRQLSARKQFSAFAVQRQFSGVGFTSARLAGVEGPKSGLGPKQSNWSNFVHLSKNDTMQTSRSENKIEDQAKVFSEKKTCPFRRRQMRRIEKSQIALDGKTALPNLKQEQSIYKERENNIKEDERGQQTTELGVAPISFSRQGTASEQVSNLVDKQNNRYLVPRPITLRSNSLVFKAAQKAAQKADKQPVSLFGHPYAERRISRLVKQPICRPKGNLIGINTGLASRGHDLIFDHGNSPIFVGIPPVYPPVKKT